MEAKVEYTGLSSFRTKVRGHVIATDLPKAMNGSDTAPTPTELFMASLGSCAALFVVRYLAAAKLSARGFSIHLDWQFDDKKTRIAKIGITANVPGAVLGIRKKAVEKTIKKCIIHNTLKEMPDISIKVEEK